MPRSVAEVAAVVERGNDENRTVRVSGSGHSCNDAVLTDGFLLSLSALDRVLDADPASGLVRVEAGIDLRVLNQRLDALGLALPVLGSIDHQTLAGAIATGTHGSGRVSASISDAVESVELVTGHAEVLELDARDPDALRAARVNLGALGVVTAFQLRCVPAFGLRETQHLLSLEEAIATLEERVRENDHVELWVSPWSDQALMSLRNREALPTARAPRVREWIQRVLLESHGAEACCRVARRAPRLAPAIGRTMAGSLRDSTRLDRSHRVFTVRRPLPVGGAEWAVPYECAPRAIVETLQVLRSTRFPSPVPLGCRCAAASDAYLSNAAGHAVCYLDLIVYRGVDWTDSSRALEALMAEFGGRPHWGKRLPSDTTSLRERYPDWDRFQRVRARLDPDRRFVNHYTRRILGLSPAEVPT